MQIGYENGIIQVGTDWGELSQQSASSFLHSPNLRFTAFNMVSTSGILRK